jgi:ParB/RepB/Spo0J family partition protein
MPSVSVSSILYDEKFNCRGPISEADVKQLAALMKESGLINPLTVRYAYDAGITTHDWHLVAGHRRYLAAKLLGWGGVEVTIVDPCTDEDAYRINLIENMGRKDLHPGQEMEAIIRVYGEKPDIKTVAKELGVGREWVRRRLKINKMPSTIKPYFFDGSLTAFDLSVLIGCPLDEQESLARQLLADKQIGVGSTETLAKAGRLRRPRGRREIQQMITTLMEHDAHPDGWRCLAWAAGTLSDDELLDIPE